MSYCFLEDLSNAWQLIRETPHSQKFMVTVDAPEELKAFFDIHYTTSSVAYVSATFIGPDRKFTDGITHRLLFDLEKIIRRHDGYKFIDFSLVFSDRLFERSFSISDF